MIEKMPANFKLDTNGEAHIAQKLNEVIDALNELLPMAQSEIVKKTEVLVNWFYKTDAILDESGLDAFHDKTIVIEEAKKFIEAGQ